MTKSHKGFMLNLHSADQESVVDVAVEREFDGPADQRSSRAEGILIGTALN